MKFKLFLAGILLCMASTTWAIAGNKLYEQMESDNKHAAMMYILGVVDVLSGDQFCLPQDVTGGQIYDVVQSHFKLLPQFRHHNAAVLIANSLKSLYPCDKK